MGLVIPRWNGPRLQKQVLAPSSATNRANYSIGNAESRRNGTTHKDAEVVPVLQRFEVSQLDRELGYDTAKGFSKAGGEIIIGVATGNVADTLAKGSKALKVVAVVIRAHDAAGNAVNVGRGVWDIRQNGLTVGNVLQVGAGGLAIAGDLGEVSEAAFKKLKIGAGELWVDELGAQGLPGDISTVGAAQRQADQVVAPKGKPLVRYGGPVTPEQLAEQAAAAAANPAYGVHGVSVILRNPPKGPHGQAAFEEAMKQFGIRQTGPNKSHYTVIIPENVTQEVADKFNALFNWFE